MNRTCKGTSTGGLYRYSCMVRGRMRQVREAGWACSCCSWRAVLQAPHLAGPENKMPCLPCQVVVGNGNGVLGWGQGKAAEVNEAVQKVRHSLPMALDLTLTLHSREE